MDFVNFSGSDFEPLYSFFIFNKKTGKLSNYDSAFDITIVGKDDLESFNATLDEHLRNDELFYVGDL